MDQDFVSHALGTVAAISSLATKAHSRSQQLIEVQQKALEVAGKQIEANANAAVEWKAEIDRLTRALKESEKQYQEIVAQLTASEDKAARLQEMARDFKDRHVFDFEASERKHFPEHYGTPG